MLLAASPVRAQRVHGTVRDSLSGIPIAGAVVWVSDSTGAVVARSIGDETGRYTVMRLQGAAHLHVVRIGFHPRDIVLARDGSDSTQDVRLVALPPNLATVSASTSRVCPGEKGSGQGLELWEQARAALLAGVIARESQPPRVRLVSYARTREPIRKSTTKSEVTSRDVVVDRSYVAARPAWAFAADGYMREETGGDRTYYAPDDETLLDPTFAETHCLHVQGSDKAHQDQVGIAFDPVESSERDTLVDIRGVLWLDRAHPALRSLEFHYTGLEPAARGSGGEIVFHVMPSGAAMIERWNISTAIVVNDPPIRPSPIRHRPTPREERADAREVGIRETGGELASAEWPNGTSWRGTLPRATGILVQDDGSPAAGARVWMLNTHDTVTSGPDGRFVLPYMLPGLYYVLATDSVLVGFGLSRTPWTAVALSRNGDSNLRMRYHSRGEALRAACEGQRYRPGTGVVLARVVDKDGAPVADARIDVWQRASPSDTTSRGSDRSGETSEDGDVVICGAPLDRALRVRATSGKESAEVSIDSFTTDVYVARLVLRPRAD
jgi:hypothetical protein